MADADSIRGLILAEIRAEIHAALTQGVTTDPACPDPTTAALAMITASLTFAHKRMEMIMTTLADIQAAVMAETNVEDSVVKLLTTLSADLQAALSSNDQAAMQDIVTKLQANATTLAAAVAANTPSVTPVPTPTSVATPPGIPPGTPVIS